MMKMKKCEINSYMKGHEQTFIKLFEIFNFYFDDLPDGFILALERYQQKIRYEADQMLDNLTLRVIK